MHEDHGLLSPSHKLMHACALLRSGYHAGGRLILPWENGKTGTMNLTNGISAPIPHFEQDLESMGFLPILLSRTTHYRFTPSSCPIMLMVRNIPICTNGTEKPILRGALRDGIDESPDDLLRPYPQCWTFDMMGDAPKQFSFPLQKNLHTGSRETSFWNTRSS